MYKVFCSSTEQIFCSNRADFAKYKNCVGFKDVKKFALDRTGILINLFLNIIEE